MKKVAEKSLKSLWQIYLENAQEIVTYLRCHHVTARFDDLTAAVVDAERCVRRANVDELYCWEHRAMHETKDKPA